MPLSFDTKLKNYADLIVQVGANVQKGQRVLLQSPVEGAALARLVHEAAYEAGASYVDVLWGDDAVSLSNFKHADENALTEVPEWFKRARIDAAQRGDALISLRASDPQLLKDIDPERVAAVQKAYREALKPYTDAVINSDVNWCLVTLPLKSWAAQVFPDAAPGEQVDKLWDAIFRAVRVDQADPVNAWHEHLAGLERRREYLNNKQYSALKYTAPGTDLTVGLPEGHLWLGGYQPTNSGVVYVANMPTEEVFTLPHKDRVDGTVQSSKPLAYGGQVIDGFGFTFKNGEVVDFHAEQGEDTLRQLLDTDAGAKRLGEVALVPHSSPISQADTLFFNTLFDENAASHLALGRAYRFTLEGGTEMGDDEARAAGANESLTHVDFMIGSAETDIDGVLPDGAAEPLMRGGEWAV